MTPSEPSDNVFGEARDTAIALVESVCQHLSLQSPGLRLSEVLDAFDAHCFIKDRTGRLAYASPGLQDLDPDSARADTPSQADSAAQLARRTDQLVLEDARTLSFVHQTVLPDGAVRYLQTQKIPLIGPDSEVVGIFGVSREIDPGSVQQSQSSPGPLGATATVNVAALLQQLSSLDARERELAQLVSRGAINKQVASHFDVSIRSVENWRRSLLAKLEMESIPELTRWVARLEDYGLLPTE